MLMRNTSGRRLQVTELGIDCAPGDVVEVADGYCTPRPMLNGALRPSILEELCRGFAPAGEVVEPPPEAPPELPESPESTLPEGVRDLIAAGKVEPPKPRGKPGRKPKAALTQDG